jgi:hypothetical protein
VTDLLEGMDEEPALELAAMSSRRLVSPSIRSVKKSGARSWSRRVCLASSSWLRAMRGSRFMTASRQRGAGATHSEIAVARFVAGCWKFKVGRRKFTAYDSPSTGTNVPLSVSMIKLLRG